ncbi:hypothetical protein D3C75_1186140 [compost metagenome]
MESISEPKEKLNADPRIACLQMTYTSGIRRNVQAFSIGQGLSRLAVYALLIRKPFLRKYEDLY